MKPDLHVTPSRQRPLRRGLTLNEVLVAVTLVGVLSAIALPMYNSSREKARSRQAVIELGQMSAIIDNYRNDNRVFPASLADVGLDGRRDPWGRPYAYYNVAADNGRGGARKDRALNPINSDFDLYSLGPDGVTKPQVSQNDSLDDVIRARNGSFFGRAADF